MVPEIGEKIRFVPSAYTCREQAAAHAKEIEKTQEVTGTVVEIHYRHGWYRVAYETDYNGTQHECFHFYP